MRGNGKDRVLFVSKRGVERGFDESYPLKTADGL